MSLLTKLKTSLSNRLPDHNEGIRIIQRDAPRVDLVGKDLRLADVVKHLMTLPENTCWMTPSEQMLLFSLALALRPKWYLEIGTFRGGSALLVASALEAARSAGAEEMRMVLIDPNPKIDPQYWARLQPYALLIQDASPRALDKLPPESRGRVDLALVDGDHSFDGVLKDARAVLRVMRSGGYICFHDAFYSDVRKAIDQFVDECGGQVTDFGCFTREYVSQKVDEGRTEHWGGLRLLFVNRSQP